MHTISLIFVCSMLAQSGDIQEILFLPRDGMPNTYYSIDTEQRLLEISYQEATANVLGKIPMEASGGAWYSPRYETLLWLEPIGSSRRGLIPSVLRGKRLDSQRIDELDLAVNIGGDEAIQPLGARWLALFEPNAFSAIFDCGTGVLHRGVPDFVARLGSRYTSVVGEIAYFGAGHRQPGFLKVALPIGEVLADIPQPEAIPELGEHEHIGVVGIHGSIALLSYGIRGEAWRKYGAFDMERKHFGGFSDEVDLCLSSDYTAQKTGAGPIEFTYISLTRLPFLAKGGPEPPPGELIQIHVDPSTCEITSWAKTEYDSRSEIAIVSDLGEVRILPRYLFDFVPMRSGFLTNHMGDMPELESHEGVVKMQQEYLHSQVGAGVSISQYGRDFTYQVRHLDIAEYRSLPSANERE